MGMGSTLGVVAKDVPKRRDDSMERDGTTASDMEISRRRRQRIVLTGVCLFAAVIFSLAALRALFR
jgi:hypothetical protein